MSQFGNVDQLEDEEKEEMERKFNNARDLVEKEINKVIYNPNVEDKNYKLSRLYGELQELTIMEEGFNDGKSEEFDH